MSQETDASRQADEALRKAVQAADASIAQYEQVVSMISDIVWRYDVDIKGQNIGSYISPVADRLLGLPEGTIGNSFEKYFSYVHPDDLPFVLQTLSEGIRTLCKDRAVEYRLIKSDGSILWVRSRGSAHLQADGLTVVFGTTSDITERKAVEETLRASHQIFKPISGSDIQENLDHDLRILLAEDNTVNQMVTQKMLSKLGYMADVVANGIEVMQALERQIYDVILMDVLMPEMDGLEATKAIRKRYPDGPKIIAKTASALVGDREMCIAAGMDGYISKPTKIEELSAALRSCSKKRNM